MEKIDLAILVFGLLVGAGLTYSFMQEDEGQIIKLYNKKTKQTFKCRIIQ